MKSIKVDQNTNDIVFSHSNGTFDYVKDNDALAQKIKILLGTNLGEIIWDRTEGVDQNSIILNGKRPDVIETVITEYLKRALNKFVTCKVTTLDFDKKNRVTNLQIAVNLHNESSVNLQVIGGDH
ncbi:hypothetical protein IV37_GL000196 [Fructilactobacillus fructivorans]|uniref:hypothetical protein n=1 Tax=Fructilactobacillus fructivorans TaxID=1614 RepID=UPI000704EED2|nr:hypothetical protein [Fructilactobacillus fructivorans]KRN13474.1 hypothetical protein IV37_GL000196 [Fructilactobacillus fructivorans]